MSVCAAYVAHKLQLLEAKWSEQSGREIDNALHSKQWHGGESLGRGTTDPIDLSAKNEGV